MDLARVLLVFEGTATSALLAMKEVEAGLDAVQAKAAEANGVAGKFAAGLGGVALAATAVGLVVTAISTKMAADFQQAMTRLITNAGETRDSVDNIIAPALLRLAVTAGYSTGQLAEGFRQVSSAGFKGAEGVQVLTVAAEGARAENADLGVVLNVVTSILNAYNLKSSDTAMVVNTLTAAMQSGKLTLQDMSAALGNVIPAASQSHVSIQEVTSAMAVMANEGIKPTNAATYLRFSILNLLDPSAKARKELAAIGLSADDLSKTLTTKGLGAAIEVLEEHIAKKFPDSAEAFRTEMAKVTAGQEDMDTAVGHLVDGSPKATAALSEITGGIRGMQAILALGGAHLKEFRANTAHVQDVVHKAGREIIGWNEIQGNMNFQLSRAKEAAEFLAITWGQHVLPVVTPVFKAFADWAPTLVSVGPAVERFASATEHAVAPWGALALHMLQAMGPFAFLIGPVAGVIGNLQTISGVVRDVAHDLQIGAEPWQTFEDGLVAMGVNGQRAGEIGHQFRQAWEGVSPLLSTIAGVLRGIDQDIRDGVPFWLALENALMGLGMSGQDAIKWGYELRQVWEAIQRALRELWQQLGQAVGPALAELARELGPLWKQLGDTFDSLKPILVALGIVLGIIGAIGMALLVGVVKGLVMALGVILPDAVHLAIVILKLFLDVLKLGADLIVGIFRLAFALVRALITGDWAGLWETAKDVFGKLGGDIGRLVGDLFDGIGTIVHAAVFGVLKFIWGLVSGVVGFFQWLFDRLVGHSIVVELVDAIVGLFMALVQKVIDSWNWFKAEAERFWTWVQGKWRDATSWIGNLLSEFWQRERDGWANIFDTIHRLASDFLDRVLGVWNSLKDGIERLASGIASSISAPFRTGLNDAIGIVNGFLGDLYNIPVIGGAISGALHGFKLPAFAAGGVTKGPSIAGEGDHPEYVIPTDRKFGARARALWVQAGKALGALQMGAAGVGEIGGQCVEWVESLPGVPFFPVQMASQMAAFVNAASPAPGLIGVSTIPPWGHTFVVTGPDEVEDSNWVAPLTVGLHRLSDIPDIVGYINLGNPLGTLKAVGASLAHALSGVLGGPLGAAEAAARAHGGLAGAFGAGTVEVLGNALKSASFDQGGWLLPGLTAAWNGTGRPERVLSPGQGGGGDIHVHVLNPIPQPHHVARELAWELKTRRGL